MINMSQPSQHSLARRRFLHAGSLLSVGHTPRISYQKGTGTGVMQPGRDHWPGAMSILVSGGGLRMGQVIGSTNQLGEAPKDRPLSPNDLWATVYRHLGIDTEHSFLDHSGRPMPILTDGEPIRELT